MDEKNIVLIVDDTPENLQVLAEMLEHEGYEVMVASNGADALEYARATPGPDLILLDIMMPDMDGYEVCRRLKADSALQRIPVIFISAMQATEEKVQAFREGAADYVSKPFQAEEVVARVRTHILLARAEELKNEIAERKQAEEKSLRLAAIVESSDDAIVGKTVDGIITSWNRGAEKIFSYSESEMLGKPITILIPDEYVAEVHQMHARIRRGEHVEHFETVRRRKDGELIFMSLTYSPIRDGQGRVVAVSTIGRDVTEQKKAATALLDNARINRELEIAKEIQQSFLRVCPHELPGLLMACSCVPAAHVGGDYYDFFSLEEALVDVVIADVAGHSVGSALLMSITRSVIRAKVSFSRSPGKLLKAVNDLLHDDLARAELQLSMFYARLDSENRTLAFANAGHTRPFLFRAGEGMFLELDADGLLMGVKKDVCFEEKVIPVESGDVLILYTDGVTEAENAEGELFGAGRLCEVIAEQRENHPKKIMAEIFQKLSAFAGPKPLSDDVTMIIIKTV